MSAIDIIIGVDPGLSGGIAILHGGKFNCVYDMPKRVKSVQRKRNRNGQMQDYPKYEVDAGALAGILREWVTSQTFALIEQVSAMRKGKENDKQGTVSSFTFGDSFGAARSVCEIYLSQDRVCRVVPTVWKKYFGLLRQPKDAARQKAIELVPEAAGVLTRKKDDGRADAILIAKYFHDNMEKYYVGNN